MGMITKGTIVVRTERAMGKLFDSYLCMGYDSIGTIFETNRSVTDRAAYATGSSIPSKGFRLATPIEKMYYNSGHYHVDMIKKPEWVKDFSVRITGEEDMAQYKDTCEIYGIPYNESWKATANYYGVDKYYEASIYKFGNRVFESAVLFRLTLEQFYGKVNLKINTKNNKNDKNENTEKISVPNTGQRKDGNSCSKIPSRVGRTSVGLRLTGHKAIASRCEAKITGRVLSSSTISIYNHSD